MFAVYRRDGDFTCSYEILLFVTDSEQTAEDAVALAQLELEAALAVPYPQYSAKILEKNGAQWVVDLQNAYAEKIKSICTIDPPEYNCHSKEVSYYYEKVEVR
jgi:hypothetical protein